MKMEVTVGRVATVERTETRQNPGELTLTFDFYRPPSATQQPERARAENPIKGAIISWLQRLP